MSKISSIFFLLIVITLNTFYGQSDNYIVKKSSKTSAILISNGEIIDSIYTKGIKSMNTYVKVTGQTVYMFDFNVPGAGSIGNSYISIKKWEIINDRLKNKKYKFILGYCKLNKLKFKITDHGIRWRYRKSLFKTLRGLIKYEDIDDLNIYKLDCTK